MKRLLQLALILSATFLCAHAEEPVIWSRQAKVLSVGPADIECYPRDAGIHAPDHRTVLTVLCQRRSGLSSYSVQVKTASGRTLEAPLDEGAHELLWSPDSQAFFVNGGTSAYSGFFVAVYRLDRDQGLKKVNVTPRAQRDMVTSFPPCKAWNRDGNEECKRIAANPHYNMSGIGWSFDSSAINIFAEIPCSSSYGGIMCQVKGYEVNAADGRVIKSYSAKAIAAAWRESLAWKVRVPDPPKYGSANATFKSTN